MLCHSLLLERLVNRYYSDAYVLYFRGRERWCTLPQLRDSAFSIKQNIICFIQIFISLCLCVCGWGGGADFYVYVQKV